MSAIPAPPVKLRPPATTTTRIPHSAHGDPSLARPQFPRLSTEVLAQPVLTGPQCASYKSRGFLLVDDFLAGDEVDHLRGIYDELFEDEAGKNDGNFCKSTGKAAARLQISNCSKYRPELLKTPLYAKALGLARQLLGPTADFWGDFALLKPAGDGGPTPWHQDEAHWSPAYWYNHLAVWVPLQDVSVENGCMSFVPGSHTWGVVPHHSVGDVGCAKIEACSVDPALAVPCPMPAGAASVHNCRTLHYAGPNGSAGPRRAYILNFGTPTKYRRLLAKRKFAWRKDD